jgi:hypothetical protein
MFRNLLVCCALSFVLAACGGGGGSSGGNSGGNPPPPADPQTSISGVVFASDVFTSGVVKAYSFTGGIKGSVLATVAINGTGAYQLTVPASSGAILIEADSGCYTEKAIPWATTANASPSVSFAVWASVCTASPSLSTALVLPTAATTLVAAVTPYTHAAVGLAGYEIRTGSTAAVALPDAFSRVSQWVGADISTTLPVAPARTATLSSPTLYGALLGGIPSWLNDVATTYPAVFGSGTLTTLALADAMKSDLLHDGVLNGTGRDTNGNAVALTVGNAPMTTTIYRHQLALFALTRLRAETEGTASPTAADDATVVSFLPSFVAYNNSVNTLVDASAVVALDEGGPVVTIGYPSPGGVILNNDGMDGFVHDCAGLPILSTVMLIDGVQYTPFVNAYHPNHFINTTIFAKGAHTLTIQATNNLGHVGSASVNVTFN